MEIFVRADADSDSDSDSSGIGIGIGIGIGVIMEGVISHNAAAHPMFVAAKVTANAQGQAGTLLPARSVARLAGAALKNRLQPRRASRRPVSSHSPRRSARWQAWHG